MSLALRVAGAIQRGQNLHLDLADYESEADATGVILVNQPWNLNGLAAVEIIGHGYFALQFSLPPNSPYVISLVGVRHVHLDGFRLFSPEATSIGILGARACIPMGGPSLSLDDWYIEHVRMNVKAEKAGIWLHGVEADNWVACQLSNNSVPLDERRRGYVVYYADNNALGIDGAGSVWQNTNAVTVVQHHFRSCTFAQYAKSVTWPTAAIGLGSNVRNVVLDGCATAPHSGALLRVIGRGNSDISIRDCNLEGVDKNYAVILDAPTTQLRLTGGLVEAHTGGIACNRDSNGVFQPNTLMAPRGVVVVPGMSSWDVGLSA